MLALLFYSSYPQCILEFRDRRILGREIRIRVSY